MCVTALLCSAATTVWPAAAQTQEPLATQPRSGFQLDSVSTFAAYYSDGFAANLAPSQSAPLAPDYAMGAAATLTWNRVTERSDFSLSYTADYSGRVRYSAWDALNHRFSLNAAHQITPLWDFRFAAGAGVSTSDQLVLLNGQLSGATPVSASLLLYGDRMLSSTALASLIYKHSTRTSFTWHAGGTRYQGLAGYDAGAQPAVVSLLGQTTSVNAGLVVTHTLSPRTQLGVDLGTTRLLSGFLDAWYRTASVSLNHALSQRWFAAVRAGGGIIQPMRPATNLTTAPQYLAGGTLGYKALAHTLQASFDHTVGDSYGLGASATDFATVSWIFARPGSPWSLRTSGGEQQLEQGVFPTVRTRQVVFSVGRALNRNLQFTAEYGYMRYSGGALFGSISPTAVRVAMVWRPGQGLLR